MDLNLKDEVLKALDTIRPFLQADSGDIELIDITNDKIVIVKLTGACGICPMFQMTLRAGIERSLLRQVPSIKRVEAIN
jgi:Fe-S cluster biogenesis protein NfuA